jgi:hypothetical protein
MSRKTKTTTAVQTEGPVLAAALNYSEHDLKIIPLIGKVPAVKGGNGHLDASSDPKQITAWWTKYPDANIGLAMRGNGLVAMDIDPRNGSDKTMAALIEEHGPLPATLVQKTGRGDGGEHHVYHDGGKSFTKIGSGIDIVENGYIVVAPSIHPDSGEPYSWDGKFDPDKIAAAPDWLPTNAAVNGTYRPSLIGLDDDPIYHAIGRQGLIHEDERGPKIKHSKDGTELVEITCPWVHLHSGKEDHGAAYFAGGGFKCQHAHCEDRNGRVVVDWLRSKGEDVDEMKRQRAEKISEAETRAISAISDAMAAQGGNSLIDVQSEVKTRHRAKNPPRVKVKASARPKPKPKPKPKKAPGIKAVRKVTEHASAELPAYPSGLVGEIAEYAERRLAFQTPNIALATGLAAVSRMNDHKAVVVAPGGRATSLNLYTLITAQTGAGKETARAVLNEIGQAIAGEDMISSSFASAQALGRELSSSTGKSLLVFQDEYGHKLAHANSGSGAHDAAVGALLLELFGLPLGSYAGRKYSKEKDDIEPAELPYVGMLAATTIEPLVGALTDGAVYDGTLNRLIYLPQPSALVRNGDLKVGEVPDDIVSAGRRLWGGSSSGAQLNSALALPDAPNTIKIRGRLFRAIRMTNAASTVFDKFDRSLDSDKERGGPRGSLAGRAAELAIRVGGVVALGCAKNLNDMRLTQVHAKFGIDLIRYSMASMLSFVDDDLGVTDPKNLVRRILSFCEESVISPENVSLPKGREYWRQYLNKGQIPHSLIVKKFRNGVTRRDRDDAIRTLVEGHDLRADDEEISGQQATFYRLPGGRDADE